VLGGGGRGVYCVAVHTTVASAPLPQPCAAPKDASTGQAEGEQALPRGCWLESRLRERIARNKRDSNPGKSTPPGLGGQDNRAVGEHTAWGSQEEVTNSVSSLGLCPTLSRLFLGLVSSTRKQSLTGRMLARVGNIQTQLQLLRFILL